MERQSDQRKLQKKHSLMSEVMARALRDNFEEEKSLQQVRGHIDQEIVERHTSHAEHAVELRLAMRKIQAVTRRIPVSPERKKFLSKHGFQVRADDFDIDAFIRTIDEVTAPPRCRTPAKAGDDKGSPETGRSKSSRSGHSAREMLRLSDFLEEQKQKQLKESSSVLRENDVLPEKFEASSSEQERHASEDCNAATRVVVFEQSSSRSLRCRLIEPPRNGRYVRRSDVQCDGNLILPGTTQPNRSFGRRRDIAEEERLCELASLDAEAAAYRMRLVRGANAPSKCNLQLNCRTTKSAKTTAAAPDGRSLADGQAPDQKPPGTKTPTGVLQRRLHSTLT